VEQTFIRCPATSFFPGGTQFQVQKVLLIWLEGVEKNVWEMKVKRDDNIRQSIGKNGCP
jgi:hypothetical protein